MKEREFEEFLVDYLEGEGSAAERFTTREVLRRSKVQRKNLKDLLEARDTIKMSEQNEAKDLGLDFTAKVMNAIHRESARDESQFMLG
jgi:hypothetical protein